MVHQVHIYYPKSCLLSPTCFYKTMFGKFLNKIRHLFPAGTLQFASMMILSQTQHTTLLVASYFLSFFVFLPEHFEVLWSPGFGHLAVAFTMMVVN